MSAVLLSLFLCSLDEFYDILFCDTTVYLYATKYTTTIPTLKLLTTAKASIKNQFDYLDDKHVLPVLDALLGEVTHVANKPGLATASLTHNHNWNTTPVEEIGGPVDNPILCNSCILLGCLVIS